MPIIKSAKKRVRVAAKAHARNLHTKRELRETLKAFAAAVEGGKSTEVAKAHAAVQSAIDTAAKKNVIHKNKAARFKARLAFQAKSAGARPAKTTAKKAAAKKPGAKKPTSRKIAKPKA